MTPHETGSTGTPGTPRATAPPARTFGPQGPTLGELSRRLPPGLPGPTVPVPEHRPRPDRPSHRVLRPRRARRRAHHLPDPPVPTGPARRRGGHRHHQSRDLGPPPHGHPRRPLGLAPTPCPASPTACARIPPARASSNTPNTSPSAGPPRRRPLSTAARSVRSAWTRSPAHSASLSRPTERGWTDGPPACGHHTGGTSAMTSHDPVTLLGDTQSDLLGGGSPSQRR